MKRVSVEILEGDLEDMKRLVEQGLYPNMSELIRWAIRDLLIKHGFAPWQKPQKRGPKAREEPLL